MCKHSHPSPLLSLPTSVQNRYFQRHSGAKTQRRRGRCSDLSAQHARTPNKKVGVTRATFSNNNYARSTEECGTIYCTHKHTHTHRETATVLLPLSGRYFLSLACRQPWQQWAGLLSQLLRRSRRRRKTGPGECPNQGLLSSLLTFKRDCCQ